MLINMLWSNVRIASLPYADRSDRNDLWAGLTQQRTEINLALIYVSVVRCIHLRFNRLCEEACDRSNPALPALPAPRL